MTAKNSSGRIWVRPLSRNTAQGAREFKTLTARPRYEVSARYDVFFIFFFFFGFVAMT
ncbi:MAG: hypothetical protein ACLQFW_18330 [Xanthobacteraceae bacterium]